MSTKEMIEYLEGLLALYRRKYRAERAIARAAERDTSGMRAELTTVTSEIQTKEQSDGTRINRV